MLCPHNHLSILYIYFIDMHLMQYYNHSSIHSHAFRSCNISNEIDSKCNVYQSTYHDYICNVNRHITQPCSTCTTLCSNTINHAPNAMYQTHMQCQVSRAFISMCLSHATLSMHSIPCSFHILLPCNLTMVQPMQKCHHSHTNQNSVRPP